MPFRNSVQSRETTIRRQQDMIKQLTIKLNEIELRNKNYHEKRLEHSNGQPQHLRNFTDKKKEDTMVIEAHKIWNTCRSIQLKITILKIFTFG